MTAGLGVRFAVNSFVGLGIDYTFENDISNDDDYSISASINKRLSLGVGKDDVYWAAYSIPFGLGSQN